MEVMFSGWHLNFVVDQWMVTVFLGTQRLFQSQR